MIYKKWIALVVSAGFVGVVYRSLLQAPVPVQASSQLSDANVHRLQTVSSRVTELSLELSQLESTLQRTQSASVSEARQMQQLSLHVNSVASSVQSALSQSAQIVYAPRVQRVIETPKVIQREVVSKSAQPSVHTVTKASGTHSDDDSGGGSGSGDN